MWLGAWFRDIVTIASSITEYHDALDGCRRGRALTVPYQVRLSLQVRGPRLAVSSRIARPGHGHINVLSSVENHLPTAQVEHGQSLEVATQLAVDCLPISECVPSPRTSAAKLEIW